jgi:hypothetical protein
MADLDPRATAQQDGQPPSAPLNSDAAGHAPRNRTADAPAAEGPARPQAAAPGGADGSPQQPDEQHAEPGDDRSGLDRAEALVDQFAARASSLLMVWGRKLLRFTSRARESAQDFWADVQDFRHGRKP